MAPAAARPPSHRFLEHTGEVRLEVRAPTLEALFAEAGRALAGLMGGDGGGGPIRPLRAVSLQAPDPAALLVDWLNELIFAAEADSFVPTVIEVVSVGDGRLTARIGGVARPEPPSLVKAATLHGARVSPVEGGFEGEVVLDV